MTDIEVGRYALRTFLLRNPASPRDRAELVPVSIYGSHWPDGTCEARCCGGSMGILRPHQSPDEDCSCGIYGTLDLADLLKQYMSYAERLVAVIAAEGATIIGDTGLRTAYARVVAYWTPDDSIQRVGKQQFKAAAYYENIHTMLADFNFPPHPETPTEFAARARTSQYLAITRMVHPGESMILDVGPGIYAGYTLPDGSSAAFPPVIMTSYGQLVLTFEGHV